MKLYTRRLLAAACDGLITGSLFLAYWWKFGEPDNSGLPQLHGLQVLLVFAAWYLYYPFIEGLTGQTLFKAVFGVKAVSEKTDHPSLGISFKRHILDPIDYAFFGAVAIVVSRSNRERKRLGDLIAGSIVVLEARGPQPDTPRATQLPTQQHEEATAALQHVDKPFVMRRALGFILDYTLFFGLMAVLVFLLGKPDGHGGRTLNSWAGVIYVCILWFLVIVLPEGILGYSFGKAIFGLRVVSQRSRLAPVLASLIRHMFDFIEICIYGGIVSAIMIKVTTRHQRIGDLVAGTLVVRDQRE